MLWIPVAVAVLIQALLFFNFEPVFAPDSALYVTRAESLVHTGTMRNEAGEPDTILTPGYPVMLAAFLMTPFGYAGTVLAQRVLWIIVVAATTWLCARLSRSAIAGVVAGIITAIDLPALQATNSVLTEAVATVLIGAAVWMTYQAARSNGAASAVLAGVLAGAAALVRPIAILFGVPLGLAMIFAGARQHRVRAAMVLLVVSLAITSTWVVRNYLQSGVATLSSISTINLLRYRAAGTLAIRDAGGLEANLQRRQSQLEAEACRVVETRFGRECLTVPIAERATVYDDVALPIIFADLPATAMQAGRAFVMIMFGGGANMLSGMTGASESSARTIALAYTVPLALLALIGVPFWWRADRLAAALLLLVVAYFVVMSLGAEAYSRFRVPFLPLYAMLAGGGAAVLLRRTGFSRTALVSGMLLLAQSPADDQLIRAARDRSNGAIAKHDLDGIAAAWMDDVHVVSSTSAQTAGKAANRERMAAQFKNRPDTIYVRKPVTIEVYAPWNVASERGEWTGAWTEPDGKLEIGGTYQAQWRKIDGRWLIQGELFVPTHCKGSKYCNQRP